jgi:hypothetical protein
MKNIVRLIVAALVLTGAVASSQASSARTQVTVSRNSALPTPMCAPDDPNACGMGAGR